MIIKLLKLLKIAYLTKRRRPVPFIFRAQKYFLNPDKSAGYHILNSTQKIAKMADLIGNDSEIVFDVGGNCGLFTAIASARLPECRFYIFEAQPELIPYIRLNCHSDKVYVQPYAVSDSCGIVDFYINPDSQQTNSLNRDAVNLFLDHRSEGGGLPVYL